MSAPQVPAVRRPRRRPRPILFAAARAGELAERRLQAVHAQGDINRLRH
ncbi:MAG: hypothetical protein JJE50_13575 [Actinomycetales bacterium]|nr:hypothetical protein [Actinomycetales bacterium]